MICFSDITKGNSETVLNCEHNFHYNCIKKWLVNEKKCPICKDEVIL